VVAASIESSHAVSTCAEVSVLKPWRKLFR